MFLRSVMLAAVDRDGGAGLGAGASSRRLRRSARRSREAAGRKATTREPAPPCRDARARRRRHRRRRRRPFVIAPRSAHATTTAHADAINRGNTVIVNPPPIYNNRITTTRAGRTRTAMARSGSATSTTTRTGGIPATTATDRATDRATAPRYGSGFGFDIGELRLQVFPRNAQVFVDGYYAGTVDDYDGTFQALKLEAGPYQIRIVGARLRRSDVRRPDQPGSEDQLQRRPAAAAVTGGLKASAYHRW